MSHKKLKILAASDIHGDSSQVRKLAEKAEKENVDLVVLCGDITSPLQTKDIIKPFKDKNKKVLLVHGNHDGILVGELLSELYKVKNLHSNTAKYQHVGLFGCGGANVGLDALSEEEIFETMKKGFYYVKDLPKKIAVTHVHPDGTVVEKISPGFGSTGLREFIDRYQPDLVLCGHVHEAAGVEDLIGKTKIINVGRNGKVIEI
ncbi:MAG TPA: metallophosphoesterase [Candidatus Nanoarchaeia archaeon]|nr:metallophosphoesterase [Candidatus Nanoarchaeia archaeon]